MSSSRPSSLRRARLVVAVVALFAATVLAGGAAAAAPSTLVPDAQSGRNAVASTLRAIGELGDANAPGPTGAPRRESFAAAGLPTISAPPDVIVSEGGIDHTIDLVVKLSAEPTDTVLVSASTASTTANSGTSCGSTDADYVAISTPQQLQFAAGSHQTEAHVSVTIKACAFVEGLVSFKLVLSNPANATISRASTLISIVNNASVVGRPRVFVRDATVDQKDGSVLVPVLLGNTAGQASNSSITVAYTTSNDTATAPGDYTTTSGTLTFDPLDTARNIVVPITNGGPKPTKTFKVTVTSVTTGNADIVDGTGIVTIGASPLTAVATPAVLAPPDIVVGEGDGYVDLVVRLSAPGTNPITVNYETANSTANTGTSCGDERDYVETDGTLTFAPLETTKVVRIEVLDCTDVEGIVSFRFNLSAPANASIARPSTLVSIVNNNTPVSTPKLFARDAVVDEKDGFVLVPVMLGGPGGQISQNEVVTVNYTTSDRTAHSGGPDPDYSPASGSLSFAPGETVKNIVVPILDPVAARAPRNFAVSLSTALHATVADGTAIVVIGSSALPPVIQPAISAPPDVVVGEGDGYVDLVVRMSAPGQNAVSVSYTTASGNASSGTSCSAADFVNTSGTLNFAPGETTNASGETTKVVRMQLLDCNDVEGFVSFRFTLSAPSNATIARASTLVSIVNNAAKVSKPRLFVRDAVVDEKDGTVLVPVMLGGPAGQIQDSDTPVTVDYATEDRTAVHDTDYARTVGTLSFAAGQTVKTVVVPINDMGSKPSRTFGVNLSNVSANAEVADGAGTVVIGSSAATPVSAPSVSAPADIVVGEGDGYVDLPVRLSAPGLNPVAVSYTTSSSTAQTGSGCPGDFVTSTGSLNFTPGAPGTPGETVKVVRVPLIDCTDVESMISFRFTLSTPSAPATIAKASTLVSLVNDSAVVSTPKLVVRDAVLDEKDGSVMVPVMLGGPGGAASDSPVQVHYKTYDGTAIAAVDYTSTEGTLNFAPGQTVKNVIVPIIDVGTAPSRSFAVSLSAPFNASIGDGTGIVVIGEHQATPVPPPAPPLPVLTAPTDIAVDEADGYIDLPVQLTPSSATPVSVSYSTTSLTGATAGTQCPADYVSTSGSLSFAPGETVKTVRVQLLDCVDVEGVVTFRLTLSSAANATISDDRVVVSLVDNQSAWTPNNTTLPTVSGTTQPGQTLLATTGDWTGFPASFQIQWQRCSFEGTGCSPIPNAPNSTNYLLGTADLGHRVRVQVTATNTLGTSLPAFSLTTQPVLTIPGAPLNVTAAAGNALAYVYFSPPLVDGGGAITYTAISSPGGIQVSGATSPILVTGLTNGVSYTFTVVATNPAGTGPPSVPSNAVTPVRRAPPPPNPPPPASRPDVPPPPAGGTRPPPPP